MQHPLTRCSIRNRHRLHSLSASPPQRMNHPPQTSSMKIFPTFATKFDTAKPTFSFLYHVQFLFLAFTISIFFASLKITPFQEDRRCHPLSMLYVFFWMTNPEASLGIMGLRYILSLFEGFLGIGKRAWAVVLHWWSSFCCWIMGRQEDCEKGEGAGCR